MSTESSVGIRDENCLYLLFLNSKKIKLQDFEFQDKFKLTNWKTNKRTSAAPRRGRQTLEMHDFTVWNNNTDWTGRSQTWHKTERSRWHQGSIYDAFLTPEWTLSSLHYFPLPLPLMSPATTNLERTSSLVPETWTVMGNREFGKIRCHMNRGLSPRTNSTLCAYLFMPVDEAIGIK